MPIAEDPETQSLADSAPPCRHVAMPNGKPLCGQATPIPEALPPDAHAAMAPKTFMAWVEENLDAPACGPCIMLAGNLRFQATVLRQTANDRVYPDRPQDAWRLLSRTAWANRFDLERSVEVMEPLSMAYSWGDFEVDPAQVETALQDHRVAEAEYRKDVLAAHHREARALCDRERPEYEGI